MSSLKKNDQRVQECSFHNNIQCQIYEVMQVCGNRRRKFRGGFQMATS